MEFSPCLKVKCVSKTRSVHKYFLKFKNTNVVHLVISKISTILSQCFVLFFIHYFLQFTFWARPLLISDHCFFYFAPSSPALLTPQLPDSPNLPTFIWSGINVGQLWLRDWESARSLHPLWVCWIHLTGDFVVANPHFPCTNNQSHCFVNDKKLETYSTSKQSLVYPRYGGKIV